MGIETTYEKTLPGGDRLGAGEVHVKTRIAGSSSRRMKRFARVVDDLPGFFEAMPAEDLGLLWFE